MPKLELHLLGGFSASVDGVLVDDRAWRLRKARTLVKLVALAPERRVHKEVAAEALWPDRDARAAANNFHQALHAARRALGGADALALVDGTVVLARDATVDVTAFETAAAAARGSGRPSALRAALALHAGELVPEDRYEPWAHARREAVREQHLALCLELAELEDDPTAAIATVGQALVAAPLHEPAHRALMRLYVRAGRRQEALAHFEALRDTLRRDLGADPERDTRALYRELLGEGDSDGRPAHNLPRALTSFVGRAREGAEIGRLLQRTRLLTLTGPGGCGKTRLALEAARTAVETTPDGVWLVELAGLSEPALVAQAALTALGVPVPAQRPAIDALAGHLAARRALLVLDNCEHLVEACARLAEAVLLEAPGVRILATSREPLRCPGEVAWRVPSLSLPDGDDLAGSEAARLFADRAAAARPGFEPGPGDAATVAELCRRLDGMPLALELAAARTAALSPAQIAARLSDSLDVLAGGSRTALTRQQTLRATIAWSHDLLTGSERVLFRRLAVFAGGFPLDAAEEVCAGGPIDRRQVVDLLARLVDKSLLVAEDAGWEVRFRLLDTIRHFAGERLAASHEHDRVALRHLDWCLALAAAHDPMSAGRRRSLRRLELDHDNLRAALAFALRRDPHGALLLATRMWRFWLDRSTFVEGTRWLDAVLAAAPEATPLRVEALLAGTGLALRRGDTDVCLARVHEAVRTARALADEPAEVAAMTERAVIETVIGDHAGAAELFDEATKRAERLGDQRLVADALHASALVPWSHSDAAGAAARVDEALARLRALGDDDAPFLRGVTFGIWVLDESPAARPRVLWEETALMFHRFAPARAIGYVLGNVAWARRATGDVDAARAALDEALGRFRALGDTPGEAFVLAHRGHLERAAGDPEAGEEPLRRALALRRELGDRRAVSMTLMGLGMLHGAAGDLAAARTELSAVRERHEAVDDAPGMAGTLSNWAVVEERGGELERAAPLFAEAAVLWERQRYGRWAAWLRFAQHETLATLGEAEGADRALALAAASFERVGDERGLALAHAAAAKDAQSRRKEAPA
jgi:predicted ATPase/DNA-binding SARP family transcriptional activator